MTMDEADAVASMRAERHAVRSHTENARDAEQEMRTELRLVRAHVTATQETSMRDLNAARDARAETRRYKAAFDGVVDRLVECETELASSVAEAIDLRARLAAATSGIVIKGWWCLPCSGFVGEEKESHDACIYCDRPKHPRVR